MAFEIVSNSSMQLAGSLACGWAKDVKWCENYIFVYVEHVLYQHNQVEIKQYVVLCLFAMVTENFFEQIVLIK